MEKNGWKTTAIILGALLLITGAYGVWLTTAGLTAVQHERDCFDQCSTYSGAEWFYYDAYMNTCTCYNNQDEIIHTKKY